MPYVLRVNRIEIAFAEGEVINSIQDVGFAHSVIANETVDVVRKFKFRFGIVLKV
jgi:hypothetical protein